MGYYANRGSNGGNKMIELLSPKQISKEQRPTEIICTDSIGWNYPLDFHWLYSKLKPIKKNSVVLDVGCGNSPFHTFAEEKLGINIVGIDREEGFCHQPIVTNTDIFQDFMDCEIKNADVVYWLSSIEHNKLEDIRKLYLKSMEVLKDGGLFLATFPVSKKTCWFEPSEQTNLSLKDACSVFNDTTTGVFENVHKEYREDYLSLKSRYSQRYGEFSEQDPTFVVGCVSKIKE